MYAQGCLGMKWTCMLGSIAIIKQKNKLSETIRMTDYILGAYTFVNEIIMFSTLKYQNIKI
jgi:hypothetical protein